MGHQNQCHQYQLVVVARPNCAELYILWLYNKLYCTVHCTAWPLAVQYIVLEIMWLYSNFHRTSCGCTVFCTVHYVIVSMLLAFCQMTGRRPTVSPKLWNY